MRVVSLVPSLTETLDALGAGAALVGVTTYCVNGAPERAARIGGTKNPDLEAVAALAPDLVLANAEENRPGDLHALRQRGLRVHVSGPDSVAATADMVRAVGGLVGARPAAEELAADIDAALAETPRDMPRRPRVVALIWRKPWMAVGEHTYAGDLLARAGFDHVLDGCGARYPNLGDVEVPDVDAVLLPSEPYRFTEDDLPAVAGRLPGVPPVFVDGEDLTWHGSRTPRALRGLAALARRLAAVSP
jgi:ABC-type Fe3+-hydroxamate transport system substrate-binding protein